MNGIKLIVFIVSRGRASELVKLCRAQGVCFSAVLHGMGTASREILSMIGVGDSEKDVVLMTAESGRAGAIMDSLAEAMRLDEPGGGVAFTIPFTAVADQLGSAAMLAGEPPDDTGRGLKSSKGRKRGRRQNGNNA